MPSREAIATAVFGLSRLLAQLRVVLVDEVRGLVREHPDDLVGRVGLHQAPTLTKMRLLSATNALNSSLGIRNTCIWPARMPAALKIGAR